MIFGAVAVFREGIFSTHLNPAEFDTVYNPRIKLEEGEEREMNSLWPLREDARSEFGLKVIYDSSEWSGATFDTWNIRSQVLRGEDIRVAGNVFRAMVISTEGSSDRGRKFEQMLWYAPDSGLILRLVRRWDSAAVQLMLNGTNPGDFQQYELIHFVFPSGYEMSVN